MKPLLIFFIVALLGVSLWWSNNEEKTSTPVAESITMLDAYMNNFSMQAMDASGKPVLQLTAKSMKQFSDSDLAELDTPRIKMKDVEQQWHIQSQQGLIDSNKQIVSLQGGVVIQHLSTDRQHRLEIRTDSLQIDIDTQIAQTETAVEMVTDEASFHSKGLVLDNRNGKLSLLADVKGVVDAD